MAISDAQKRAKKKWDGENLKHIGANIPQRDAEAFAAACQRAGVSQYRVLLDCARDFVAQHPPSGDGQTDSGTGTAD